MHLVPERVKGSRTELAFVEGSFAFDLGGVWRPRAAGDTLYLRLDGAKEQYGVNGGRIPGAANFMRLRSRSLLAR